MIKRILYFGLLVATLLCSANLFAQTNKNISNIEKRGSWYDLYDNSGNRIKTMSVSSIGEIIGFSAQFFISRHGTWYDLYDASGKRYKTLSVNTVGEIVSVSGNTFTSRRNNWIDTYNSQGKRINTRAAR